MKKILTLALGMFLMPLFSHAEILPGKNEINVSPGQVIGQTDGVCHKIKIKGATATLVQSNPTVMKDLQDSALSLQNRGKIAAYDPLASFSMDEYKQVIADGGAFADQPPASGFFDELFNGRNQYAVTMSVHDDKTVYSVPTDGQEFTMCANAGMEYSILYVTVGVGGLLDEGSWYHFTVYVDNVVANELYYFPTDGGQALNGSPILSSPGAPNGLTPDLEMSASGYRSGWAAVEINPSK